MPPLIKVGPCHDIFINLASRLVNHMLFISVCEKTLDFRGTNWNNDMGTFQVLFIFLGFTASDWVKSGELWIKSQPFLLSLIYSAAPAGINSHCGLFTLSLANKSQNMACALVSITLLPLKTRFGCTSWGIAPDKHIHQFHIKTTLMLQQSCVSHSAATDAPI